MGILIITDEDEIKIKAIVEEARTQAVPLSVVQQIGILPKADVLTYKEIKDGAGGVPATHCIVLGNYRAAFSFECQPHGLVRHLSVSVDTAEQGNIPQPIVVETISKSFGFTEFPPTDGRVWMEEYRPGEWCVNVIQLVQDVVQPISKEAVTA